MQGCFLLLVERRQVFLRCDTACEGTYALVNRLYMFWFYIKLDVEVALNLLSGMFQYQILVKKNAFLMDLDQIIWLWQSLVFYSV